MRGKIPAQAPYEGEEPTMRKGSYSEELVKIVVDACQGGSSIKRLEVVNAVVLPHLHCHVESGMLSKK